MTNFITLSHIYLSSSPLFPHWAGWCCAAVRHMWWLPAARRTAPHCQWCSQGWPACTIHLAAPHWTGNWSPPPGQGASAQYSLPEGKKSSNTTDRNSWLDHPSCDARWHFLKPFLKIISPCASPRNAPLVLKTAFAWSQYKKQNLLQNAGTNANHLAICSPPSGGSGQRTAQNVHQLARNYDARYHACCIWLAFPGQATQKFLRKKILIMQNGGHLF